MVGNWMLALGAVVVTLVLVEVALRVRAYLVHNQTLAGKLADTGQPPRGAEVTLGQMIRIASNPHIIYELRPDLDVIYKGASVSTNDLGFRGPALEAGEAENRFRIVGIGDSVMFGQAIEFEETYLYRLQRGLVDRYPQLRWETINTAVPGYNTVMEVETLKDKVLPLGPDLVVIDLVDNDFSLPNFIATPEQKPDTRSSMVLTYIFRSIARLRHRPDLEYPAAGASVEFDPRGLIPTPPAGEGIDGFANRPDLAPPRYAEIVGIDAFRKAILELQTLSSQHSFVLVAVTMHKDLGVPLIDAGAAILRYVREKNIPLRVDSPLRASEDDAHPSGLSHEIAAAEILRRIDEWKLIPSPDRNES
ncbi:MAG: SGNH/GDSL hydrolase family protein [Acidobacteriota bacterium]